MTQAEQEKMISDYLEAILTAVRQRALEYHGSATSIEDKFVRVTEMKNAFRAVGDPNTFGIMAFDYSRCHTGQCVGGVCVQDVAFRDSDLDSLAQELAIPQVNLLLP